MKRLITGPSAAVALARAAPAVGIWQTEVDAGACALLKWAPSGAAICGTIARTFNDSDEYKSKNIGKKLVVDMVL